MNVDSKYDFKKSTFKRLFLNVYYVQIIMLDLKGYKEK